MRAADDSPASPSVNAVTIAGTWSRQYSFDMQTAHPVDYAVLTGPRRSFWPEAILAALGLGLIFLGGCFLIGVASVYEVFAVQKSTVPAGPQSPGEVALVAVLYLAATLCFIGAATVIGLAVIRLIKR